MRQKIFHVHHAKRGFQSNLMEKLQRVHPAR